MKGVIQAVAQISTAQHDAEYDQLGVSIGRVFKIILLVVIGVVIVLLLLKKYSYVRVIRNIFSVFFISWGIVCVILYAINLFNGESFYYLILGGLISLAIGIGLRYIKIPVEK